MIAREAEAPAVGANLLEYLQFRLSSHHLRYAEGPTPINDGWETYIHRFRLAGDLPPAFARPLIVRIYASPEGLQPLRHELATQRHMRAAGYPVPEPILLEEDCSLFGGPFMIMEWLPGRTLLDLMLSRPWRIIDGPGRMAEMHARLHQLPAWGFPAPTGSFLGRRLEELRTFIHAYDLAGLVPGLDWLRINRPPSPGAPCIIHMDIHPVNLLFHEGRCSGVLDWSESDVGDRHADVAATLVLIQSAPVEIPNFLQRLAAWPGRAMLWRRYLRGYRRFLPLDERKLGYYMALAALRRLCRWGMWRRASPRITGAKPSSMRYLNKNRVAILERCFYDHSGIAVSL